MPKRCVHGADTERFTAGPRKGRCKECSRRSRREYNIRRYPRDIEAGRARSRTQAAESRAKNPERSRARSLKNSRISLGGIDPPDYTRDGACDNAGCSYTGPLEWDHNHAITDRPNGRGWLCRTCNTALGMVNDDISRLEGLIAYLRAHDDSAGHPPDAFESLALGSASAPTTFEG